VPKILSFVFFLNRRAAYDNLINKIIELLRMGNIDMSTAVSTTKMSSRGQIVIPDEIRERMGLGPGAQFMVLCGDDNDVLLLKKISPPSKDEFKKLMADFLSNARNWAKDVGLSEADIKSAIKESRKKD
jgi:AbrB family looped-hinge helix DNA binding protein